MCYSLHGLSGEPARLSIVNHLRNGIIVWRAATFVGANVPRHSIIGDLISMFAMAICWGLVSIATNLDVLGDGAATITEQSVRLPRSIMRSTTLRISDAGKQNMCLTETVVELLR
jgi:hypothetical protein